MTTPQSSYDYDMRKRSKTLVKREEVLGGFDPAELRHRAAACDRVRRHQGPDLDRLSQGIREGRQPSPAPLRLRILRREHGRVVPLRAAQPARPRLRLRHRPHPRRPGDWAGPGTRTASSSSKKNTFTDFIACAEHLVREKYTRPDRLFAQGGSAGGLLMGAVINIRPDLFKGVVAAVPFVDVVTTMLDPSIPLTTFEYDEWGNPDDRTYFDYMLSYSPYDNVEAKNYPEPAGHDLAPGFAGAILGACQVGRQAPRDQDRLQPSALPDLHEGEPRRGLGTIQTLSSRPPSTTPSSWTWPGSPIDRKTVPIRRNRILPKPGFPRSQTESPSKPHWTGPRQSFTMSADRCGPMRRPIRSDEAVDARRSRVNVESGNCPWRRDPDRRHGVGSLHRHRASPRGTGGSRDLIAREPGDHIGWIGSTNKV